MSSEERKVDPGSPQGEGFEELFEGFAAATPGGSKIEGAGGSDGDGAGAWCWISSAARTGLAGSIHSAMPHRGRRHSDKSQKLYMIGPQLLECGDGPNGHMQWRWLGTRWISGPPGIPGDGFIIKRPDWV